MKTLSSNMQLFKLAFALLLMSCSIFQLSAQSINAISASPNPATTNNNISIRVDGQLANYCWSVNGVSSQRNGFTIDVFIDFQYDSAPFCIQVARNFSETVNLAPLAAGTYTLRAFRAGSNFLYAISTLIVTDDNGGGGNGGGGNNNCACSNPNADEICDDFESYSNTKLGPQSACWTTMSGVEGGDEDGRIYQSGSNKYLRMQGQTNNAQNVVLKLGNRNSGVYELSFDLYNYSTSSAFYALLNEYGPGNGQIGTSVYCFSSGFGYVVGGGGFGRFDISTNQWNRFSHYIDLEKNLARLYINGSFIYEWTYDTQGGVEKLGGVSFAANSNGYLYNVDNVSMTAYGSGCVDISQVRPDVFCPQVYDPVCGCDGREYSNDCAARNAGLMSWTDGPCGSACVDPTLVSNPGECPAVIDWVCGCDGNTYFNECIAEASGVSDWTDGPCGESCIDPNVVVGQNVYCPQVYDPVCGCDGEEYYNECAAARNGVTDWTPGPCCINPQLINPNPVCPAVINWVCGCDGNTYMNECLATSRGVTNWTNGPCNEICVSPNVIIDETVVCPQVYDPVCGCNGQEYSNECSAALDGVISWVPGPCQSQSCGNDPFEPNETVARRIYTGATNYALLCPTGDFDWFYFYSSSSAPNVRVQLSSLPDDYELFLYDNNFNLLASSTRPGTLSEEVIFNTGGGTQRYFVKIDGWLGAWDNSDTYRLRADRSASPFSFDGGSETRNAQSDQKKKIREVPFPTVKDEPVAMSLGNAPNPFNGFTNINFELPETTEVSLRITDLQGRVIAQLLNEETMDKGAHQVRFEGHDLSPGIYLCVLTLPEGVRTHKLLVGRR